MELLMLPDELLAAIVAFLDEISTSCVAAVCTRLNDLAEPFLYKSINVSKGSQAVALAKAVARRPSRAAYIRTMLVSTRFEWAAGINQLPGSLDRMRNLQDLSLETPDCNMKSPEERVPWIMLQDRYERIFQHSSLLLPPASRSLPRLRSCTLHFVDDLKELCSLSKYASLFLHPSLRSLRISCASTGYPSEMLPTVQNDPQFKHSSALECLHFEECDLLPDTLAILLSFPKALKSLIISEGIRYKPRNGFHVRRHGNMVPEELIQALNVQSESLEHLSLSLGFALARSQSLDDPQYHLDLSALELLRNLELDRRALRLMAPRGRNPIGRLPPNIESLKVFRLPLIPLRTIPASSMLGPDDLQMPLCEINLLKRIKSMYPTLKTLTYVLEYSTDFDGDFEDAIDAIPPEIRLLVRMSHAEMHRSEFQLNNAAMKFLRDRSAILRERCDLQLRIGILVTPPGFIPPYLHFESQPVERVLFDCAVPGAAPRVLVGTAFQC